MEIKYTKTASKLLIIDRWNIHFQLNVKTHVTWAIKDTKTTTKWIYVYSKIIFLDPIVSHCAIWAGEASYCSYCPIWARPSHESSDTGHTGSTHQRILAINLSIIHTQLRGFIIKSCLSELSSVQTFWQFSNFNQEKRCKAYGLIYVSNMFVEWTLAMPSKRAPRREF